MLPSWSNHIRMQKELNRLKVVLAEKKVTNRLLVEKPGKGLSYSF